MDPVYLDHNATTPLGQEARAAMLPWLDERWGNPSSIHRFGQAAREAVENARGEVARLLGATPLEIVFTASGTEANNSVVFALAAAAGHRGHVVISSLEHPAIRVAVEHLEALGLRVTRVPPQADGVVSAERFVSALEPDTLFAALMLANNEVGTLQPVAAVAEVCRQRGVPLLCDAVQAVGKVPVDVERLGVDYLVLGGHKFYGPLGGAALWVRPGAPFVPYLLGGSQERRRRASTENVPAVVGLGAACAAARVEMAPRTAHLLALRERFEQGLAALPDVVIHAPQAPRLPQTSHVAFHGVEGEALLVRLDLAGFAVSTGSACSSGVVQPSKMLLAMGIEPREALSSLRISFGIGNTLDEVDRFLIVLEREVAALRAIESPRRATA